MIDHRPVPVSSDITVNLGEFHSALVKVSIEQVRTVKEQIIFYIKQGLQRDGYNANSKEIKETLKLSPHTYQQVNYSSPWSERYRFDGGFYENF